MNQSAPLFQSNVQGIPCLVRVDHFKLHAAGELASYACFESAFTVLDRKGYKAPWLSAKLTREEADRIREEIEARMT